MSLSSYQIAVHNIILYFVHVIEYLILKQNKNLVDFSEFSLKFFTWINDTLP